MHPATPKKSPFANRPTSAANTLGAGLTDPHNTSKNIATGVAPAISDT